MSKGCTFCNIASKQSPASIVYENERVMAFMDIHPVNIGHTLVIPKEHWETIYEVPETILADLFILVKKVAIAAKRVVGAHGINILQCNERAAFQSERHFHVHVIPRFEGDPISKAFMAMLTPINLKITRQDLDRIAKEMRRNLPACPK